MAVSGELYAYALLVLVGFLPTELWRATGLLVARGIDESSELFLWTRAVATAVLAGVIAKIIVYPPGLLADVGLPVRLGAIGCGLVVFLLARRSVLAGVLAGEIMLIAGTMLLDR